MSFKNTNRRQWIQWAAAGCSAAVLPQAFGQAAWPASRPITIIVPNAAGGPADILARAVATPMAKELGVPVIVDNKPGAAGKLGMQTLLRAPRDGHTIAVTSVTALSALPVFDPNLTYKSPEDVAPLSLAVRTPAVWCVHPSLGIRSLSDLVAYAKIKPNELNYASFGINSSSHLAQEDFFRRLDINLTHVPYKGESAGVAALLSNEVQVMQISGNAKPFIEAGRLTPLATTSAEPWEVFPKIVTANRAGLPELEDYSYEPWVGFSAAANIPEVALQKLRTSLQNGLKSPEVTGALNKLGFRVVAGNDKEMREAIEQDMALYRVLLRSGRVSIS